MIQPNINIGDQVLVTTDNWFYAPDGAQYRAVFGTVHAVRTAEDTLGVKPNSRSMNWYLEIGNMTIAGCQIHYVVKTDRASVNLGDAQDWKSGENAFEKFVRPSVIYNADWRKEA